MSSPKAHPLMARELSFIHSWSEWKRLWETAKHAETLHGLLHVGFRVRTVSEIESTERLKLYLEIADGFSQLNTFKPLSSDYPQGGEHIYTPLAQGWPERTMREVSCKAFITLCEHVFTDASTHHREYSIPGVSYEPDWARLLLQRDALGRVLWFLRLNDDRRGRRGLQNAEGYYGARIGKHFHETFASFALDLARFIFRAGDHRDMLDGYKPAAVDVLVGLQRIDLLLNDDYRKTVDEACMARIRELSLEFWIHAEDHRQVKTLQEACLAGSQAAKVFLLLETMEKESKRLEDIARLQRQRNDAEDQLKRMSQ